MIGLPLALLLLQPQDPAAQMRRMELEMRLRELAESKKVEPLAQALQRALRGGKHDPATAELCYMIVARYRFDLLEPLIAAWDKTVAPEPPTREQGLLRARMEEIAGRQKEHHVKLEALALKFPPDGAVLWHLGEARLAAADAAGAVEAWERLQQKPEAVVSEDTLHVQMARAYARTGRTAPALEHLRAAQRNHELEILAEMAVEAELYEEAARLYGDLYLEEPARIALRMRRSRCFRQAGMAREAAAELKAALSEDPEAASFLAQNYLQFLPRDVTSAEMASSLRDLLRAVGDIHSAVKTFDRCDWAIRLQMRVPLTVEWEKFECDPLTAIILARMKKKWEGSSEKALAVLEAAEKKLPESPWIVLHKIEFLEAAKRHSDVAAAYERLSAIDPEGKLTGAPLLEYRRAALKWHLDAGDGAKALRLGVLLLSDSASDPAQLRDTRKALVRARVLLGEGFWDEVRKVKVPPPSAAAARDGKRLLEKLADDDYTTREGASKELVKLGLPLLPVLLPHLDAPDADLRTRIREIVAAILSE